MKNNTVLFVDDDAHIINSLERGLLDEEYRKKFAYSGDDALKILEKEKISVIVTDMRMPGMSGLTLLKIINEKYPDIIKIVLSGYTQLPQILATINQVNIFKFITKPWNLEEELIPIIRQAIEYYNFTVENKKMREEIEKKNTLYTQILKSTNEKFTMMNKDFENIRMISYHIFQYLKDKALTESKDSLIYDLNMIQDIHEKYMDTLPTENIKFSIEKIIKDLNSYVFQNHPNSTIRIHGNDQNNYKFHGNYKLLTAILTTFIKHTLTHHNTLTISISTEEHHPTIGLFFNIEILQNQLTTKDVSSFIPLFNQFGKIIDGKFNILNVENDYKILSFNIEFPHQI